MVEPSQSTIWLLDVTDQAGCRYKVRLEMLGGKSRT